MDMIVGGIVYVLSDQFVLSLIQYNMYEEQVISSYSYTNIEDCVKNMMYVYTCKYNKLDESCKIDPITYQNLSLLESAEAMLITTTATMESALTIYPDKLSASDKNYIMWYMLNQPSFTLSGITCIH